MHTRRVVQNLSVVISFAFLLTFAIYDYVFATLAFATFTFAFANYTKPHHLFYQKRARRKRRRTP